MASTIWTPSWSARSAAETDALLRARGGVEQLWASYFDELIEMVAERNLALDVNLSGIRKGVGICPHPDILPRASELGCDYEHGLEAVREAGYRYYVSFSRGLPEKRPSAGYLLEVDGVWLPIPISPRMIIAVHANRPGVVLVLLSALASKGVNVVDLQLGARGDRNFAALGIEGDGRDVAEVLTRLGPQYLEASQVELGSPLSPG